jgi:hypothetical protein
MKELPPLPDDVAALLKAADAGAPPPPPGLEAAVLAKVTATTAAAAGVTAAVSSATSTTAGASAGVAGGTAGTTLFGAILAKPLAAIALAVTVGASGIGIGYVALPSSSRRAGVPPVTAPSAPVVTTPPLTAPVVVADPIVVDDAPAPDAPAKPVITTRSESDLLEDARGKLSLGDGAGALEVLRLHGRAYPRGKLHEERRALTVVAYAQQGDKARAQTAARSFERDHPSSLFLEMVRAAVDVEGGTQ